MQNTPAAITPEVLKLCAELNSTVQPAYIKITPATGCMPNDCFDCVRQKVARDGGRIQFGWVIWEWPRVFIEAEHHAVYEGPGTPLEDITPSAFPDIQRRLFLPDDAAVYNFEDEGVLKPNVRLALCDDPLIDAFFAAAKEREDILNSIPGVNVGFDQVSPAVRSTILAVEQKEAQFIYQLGMKYTPRNARCFCGSDEKFKRCHGRGA